ncbi:hypothetical protein ACLPHD_12410 [Serratia odorifera]|uniref:hypothetical protein n=1 Tax=Serratia odorifera TaxID=618 RepID=UPI003D2B8945
MMLAIAHFRIDKFGYNEASMDMELLMKQFIVAIIACLLLASCDTERQEEVGENVPRYVTDAQNDVRNAIIANVLKTPDFKCNSILASDEIWTMGCFIHEANPMPFLLFVVYKDTEKSNPPFEYKLIAVNGKAKQFASNSALKMFRIDTETKVNMDIDSAINLYIDRFVKK